MKIPAAILTLLFAALPVAAADPVIAEKPTFKVGDYWAASTTQSGSNPSAQTSRQTISEIDASGNLIFSEGGRLDSSLNSPTPSHPATPSEIYRFPMQAGSKWQYHISINPGADENGSFEVVGFEPVTVAAGTFNCVHIEGEIRSGGKYQNYWDRIETWYCPSIKRVAKRVDRISLRNAFNLGRYDVRTYELTAFGEAP
jgi:hypothetical protein